MKTLWLFGVILSALILTTGVASARGHFGFGLRFYSPPVIVGPPVNSVPPPAYPYSYPYGSYGPGYGNRVWVPGYWDSVWTAYGWQRVWRPGHWEYSP